jgi:hypothetical protein
VGGFCECSDEPSGSGTTEVVNYLVSSVDLPISNEIVYFLNANYCL